MPAILSGNGDLEAFDAYTALLFVLPVLVAGCANVGLRQLQSNSKGPDEFGIRQLPRCRNLTTIPILPKPTPGGPTCTDRSAVAEGVEALGGTRG